MPNQDTTTPDTQARARLREAADNSLWLERTVSEMPDLPPENVEIIGWSVADGLSLLDRLDSLERVVEAAGDKDAITRMARNLDEVADAADQGKVWWANGEKPRVIADTLHRIAATLDSPNEEGETT